MQPSKQVERDGAFDDSPSTVTGGTTGAGGASSTGGRLDGAKRRLNRLFSPRAFVLAFVFAVLGVLIGSAIPIIGSLGVGRFLGMFIGTFILGMITSRRHYAEVGVAGALALSASFLLSAATNLLSPMAPWMAHILGQYGVQIALFGAVIGFVVSIAGYYFGRDLRNGVTKELS